MNTTRTALTILALIPAALLTSGCVVKARHGGSGGDVHGHTPRPTRPDVVVEEVIIEEIVYPGCIDDLDCFQPIYSIVPSMRRANGNMCGALT